MKIKNTLLLKKLEKTGFTDKEALVYLALLELGGAFPSKLAEYTSLNRSTVYKILLNLSIKGIVNEIENRNKLFYQIEKPERFIKYSENRVKQAEEFLEKSKLIIPEINQLHNLLGEKPKITYYEGIEGIIEMYQDHFSTKKPYEMLAWADATELKEFLPKAFFDDYVKTKEKLGIITRGIIPDTSDGRKFNQTRYDGLDKKVWPQIRFASPDKFPISGEIVIYGKNKVSITNFSKTNAIGTIIEDEKIHNMLKSIFNLCWESNALKN